MAVITLEDYKTYAGINTPSSDAKLEPIVSFANEYVTDFCNTKFEGLVAGIESIVEVDTEGFAIVPTAPAKVTAISEVFLDGSTVSLDSSYYSVDSRAGLIKFSPLIPKLPELIKIVYDEGFESAPESIMLATMELVTHIHKREFMQSASLGGDSANFAKTANIPEHIKLALNMYRVI